MSYRCPTYRQEVYGDPTDPITDSGGPEDYDVLFSRTPILDSRGLLAGGFSGDEAENGATCSATLPRAEGSTSPYVSGGRIFWQAQRDCIGCVDQRPETSPVRSFVVRPARVRVRLRVPRLFAGYLSVFTLESKAKLGGSQVALQRRAGTRWRTVVQEGFSEKTKLIAKLPAGRQTIRFLAKTTFATRPLATRVVTVRRGGRRVTSARDDGRYALPAKARKGLLGFRVTNGGRTVRGFRSSVTTFCITGSIETSYFETHFAVLYPVPIAPDGSVVGRLKTKRGSEETLIGRLRGGRFTGEVSVYFKPCVGTRKLDLRRGR